ncbi:hypothetical protein OAT18_02760 [Tenacibaculum sp.]|nr:hypothetical protein [Tenacibaculum sp.]
MLLIQFVPVKVEERICPEVPTSPLLSVKVPDTFTLLENRVFVLLFQLSCVLFSVGFPLAPAKKIEPVVPVCSISNHAIPSHIFIEKGEVLVSNQTSFSTGAIGEVADVVTLLLLIVCIVPLLSTTLICCALILIEFKIKAQQVIINNWVMCLMVLSIKVI